MGEELVGDDPFGEFVPFVDGFAVYAESPFAVLYEKR